jgi:hypothetical protein
MNKPTIKLIISLIITAVWTMAAVAFLLYPLFRYIDTSDILVPSPITCIGFVLTLIGLAISVEGIVSFFRFLKQKTLSITSLIPTLLLICFIAGWFTLAKYSWKRIDRIDKDTVMIENFHKHRAEFKKMVEMIKTDTGLERVDWDCTRPENLSSIGIAPERIAQYRELFKKAGVPRGFCYRGYGIEFIAGAWGLCTSSISKGYFYTEYKPPQLVENLDEYRSQDSKSFPAYRHIEGNWYLYFNCD